MDQFPDTRLVERLKETWTTSYTFLEKSFRDRELILRDEGRVRCLRITRSAQFVSVVVIISIFGWAFGMTALWDFQRDVIDEKIDKIKSAEVTYGNLLDEIITYQEKVAVITTKLQEKHAVLLKELVEGADKIGGASGSTNIGQNWGVGSNPLGAGDETRESLQIHLAQIDIELEQMTETTNLLEETLSEVKARIARAEFERDGYARQGDNRQDQIRALQDQLVKTRARAARLDRVKMNLDQNLEIARDNYGQIATERGILKQRTRELENDLGASRARGDSLHAEVTKLGQDLDQAQEKIATVVGHRSALRALVARLETQLQSAEKQINSLEFDFNDVIAKLEVSAGGREDVTGDVTPSDMPFRQRADIFLGQLAALHNSQETVLDQLHNLTAGNVKDAERVIELTGLNLVKMFKQAGALPDGKGGPIVSETAAVASGKSILVTTLTDVENHVTRWEALKAILKSLPLISPVDYYHVASRYGKRRDPFTKRWSMHYGLDLAGWRKAPVFAGASGKVVFAGLKGRYGKMVEIDHGNGIRTRYGHLFKIIVRKGQNIGHRHKIGLLGSSGRSTGPHVHYEILFNGKQLDPLKFIKAGRHVFKEPKAANKPKSKGRRKTG